MSMQDPISDMLTRIRNGQRAAKTSVVMPGSKQKKAIAAVLQNEGYIDGFEAVELDGKPALSVELRYFDGQPVIRKIERVSKPSLRVYRGKDDLPEVLGGLGVAIISTSKGLMSDRQARSEGQGGEVLCFVS